MRIGQCSDAVLDFLWEFLGVKAVYSGCASVGFQDCVQNAQGGGFPSAIWTEQTGDLAVRSGKGYPSQRDDFSEGFVQVIDFNHTVSYSRVHAVLVYWDLSLIDCLIRSNPDPFHGIPGFKAVAQ